MTAVVPQENVAALTELLEALSSLHGELAVVLRRKLETMRCNDASGMHSATAREGFLIGRATQLDAQRHAVIGRIARAIGVTPEGLTVGRIAEAADEPARTRLKVLSAGLRERMLAVGEANRTVAMVTGEMLAHYRHVFTQMTRSADEPASYTRRGGTEAGPALQLLDAVG